MKLKYQYQSLRHLISSTLASFGRIATGKKKSTFRVLPERLKDMINGLWTALLSIYATILGMIIDNSVVAVKFLADYLRYNGYVHDDTPKYFVDLRITFDGDLKKDQYLAKIICYNYTLIENDSRTAEPNLLHSDEPNLGSQRGTVRRPTRRKGKPATRPKTSKRSNK
jgi:hypothetical protein